MACPPPGSHQGGNGAARPPAARAPLESESREPRQPERESREPRCAMCGGPWRDLGHCKGVCLRCGFMQSCVDTI